MSVQTPGANSVDPDQTAPDQGLHYLSFRLHRLDSLIYGRAVLLKFWNNYISCFLVNEYYRNPHKPRVPFLGHRQTVQNRSDATERGV